MTVFAIALALLFNTNIGRNWIKRIRREVAKSRLEAAIDPMRAAVVYYGSKEVSVHRDVFPDTFVVRGGDVTEDAMMRLVSSIRLLDPKEKSLVYFKLCDTQLSCESVDRLAEQLPSGCFELETNGVVVYRNPRGNGN